MPKLSVLLIGDATRPEFREALSVLRNRTRLFVVPQIAAAGDYLQRALTAPELIVLAQARPGQFSDQTVEPLRRQVPLARWMALLGSYCEGETRTGRPLAGVARVMWYDWPARFGRMLESMHSASGGSLALPATASEEERLLAEVHEREPGDAGLIVVHSRHFDMADALAGACRTEGFSTVWIRPELPNQVQGAAAILWDGETPGEARWAELERLASCTPDTAIVALLTFPRIEDCRRALALGASAVVAKPLLLDDLCWQLRQVLRRKAVELADSTVKAA